MLIPKENISLHLLGNKSENYIDKTATTMT